MSAYKPYPAYKDSGVEWLGDVPEGWVVLPMKRISHLCTERSESRSFQVGLEQIESWSGRFIEGDVDFEGGGIAFQPGDILFGKLRPYLAKVWLADRAGEAVGDFHVIRVQPPNVPDFVHRILLSRDVISLIDGSTYGAKMPRASWEFIGAIPTPVPKSDEQTAIATFLDRETSKIDRLIAAQRRLIDLLREKRSALISHAVTKGLNPDAPMKDSGVEWLGEVPEHWKIERIKRSIFAFKNGVWGDEAKGNEYDIPCVRVADFDRNKLCVRLNDPTIRNVVESERNGRILAQGDLLIERSGGGETQPVGFVVIYDETTPAVCSNFVARVVVATGMSPSYWRYAHAAAYAVRLNTRSIKQTSGIQNLDTSQYFDERAGFPPPIEQTAIAAFLDRETAKIDALIAKTEKAIELAQERRSALISAAVTGKIDVRDASMQSPVDQETAPV